MILQLNSPNLEEDILASGLRRQKLQIQEVIDAIERRDITREEVKNYLNRVDSGIRELRKKFC